MNNDLSYKWKKKDPNDYDCLDQILNEEYERGHLDNRDQDSYLRHCYVYSLLLELKHRRELQGDPCYYIKSCKQQSCKGCTPSIICRYKTCKHWIKKCCVCDIDGNACTDGFKGKPCKSYEQEEENDNTRTNTETNKI